MLSRLVTFAAATLVLTACGGGQTPTSPSPPPQPGALRITCPSGAVASTTGTTAAVTFPAPTTTGGVAPVTVTCSPFSGSPFPIGTTTVACQATDARSTAAACSFLVVVSRIPTLRLTRFLAFGDSITAGEVTVPVPTAAGAPAWGLQILVPPASYPTQLESLLRGRYLSQASAISVVNAGLSGEQAVDGARRFPDIMASTRPEAVLLLAGYNDLTTFGMAGVSRAVSAMDTMAREARVRGARVFLASLTPSRPGGRNTIPPAVIDEFNARLRTLASGEGAVFVDLHRALLPSVPTYIGVDGLHPTEAGYRRMAEEFLLSIRTTLETP